MDIFTEHRQWLYIFDKKVWKRRGRNNVWSPTRQAPVAYGTFSTIPKQHRHSTIPSDSCNKWRGILGHKSLNSWKGPNEYFSHLCPLKVTSRQHESTDPCPLKSSHFWPAISDSTILREHNPSSASDLSEPLLVSLIGWKVVIVDADIGTRLA